MRLFALLGVVATLALPTITLAGVATTQRASAFYPKRLLERARANIDRDDWGRNLRAKAIELAEPWKQMSDDKLWRAMFGPTLPRSWMVWSNGYCPSCKKPVPMYDWQFDALNRPWKMRCPHCEEEFPKNDFGKFYQSGLDAHGVFDPKKADRSLLFNTEHPEANDPLHTFGVDDGEGYADAEGHRWRFISAYLVYGQWKNVVHLGIKRLATAYVVTGEPAYAHKAAILLDRVADVYPGFDFRAQGILYESVRGDGYVSVWHDATIETREMAMAYDAIKEAIANDADLVKFLSQKSRQYQTPHPKASAADIAENIEQGILRDALANQHKIYSNYPQQYLTVAAIKTVLGWPGNRDEVMKMLDPVIEKTTAVDGTTGEKGMANYSCYAAQRFAEFLGYYARIDDKFLPEMVQRHPNLPQMWRFFIDTWCAGQKYYPLIGDTGYLAGPTDYYVGVAFLKDQAVSATGHMSGVLTPSMYTFLWQLYHVTKDPAFVQVLYKGNESKLDNLPYDLFQDDPEAFRKQVKQVLETSGTDIVVPSVNKQQWHLAILRSGQGKASRAAWLDYDAGGNHGHFDCLNLGLFARGLDLMPDFGYPPVQFGGWGSQRAQWYVTTASHNTVLVNGAQQANGAGQTTLFAAGDGISAVAASAPTVYPGVTSTYERTVAMIDVSPDDAYVLDVFRVAGGTDHAHFFLSHFGTISTSPALASMEPASDFANPQMRDLKVVRKPAPGWSVNWTIDDRYKLLPPDHPPVHVRYTDFTTGADAYTCQAWAVAGSYNSTDEVWLPRVMVRRTGNALESTFVSLIEPYSSGKPLIRSASRMTLTGDEKQAMDAAVALKVDLADGRQDLLVSNRGQKAVASDSGLRTDAALCFLRRDSAGRPETIAVSGGSQVVIGDLVMETAPDAGFVQVRFEPDGSARPVAGKREAIKSLKVGGREAL